MLLWGLEQLHIQFKESMLVHGRRKFKVARRWRKKKPQQVARRHLVAPGA